MYPGNKATTILIDYFCVIDYRQVLFFRDFFKLLHEPMAEDATFRSLKESIPIYYGLIALITFVVQFI